MQPHTLASLTKMYASIVTLIIYIFPLFLSPVLFSILFGFICSRVFLSFPFGENSVKTDLHTGKAVSRLYIANANRHDSGNYTCAIGDFAKVTVAVHVLNGKFTFLFILLFLIPNPIFFSSFFCLFSVLCRCCSHPVFKYLTWNR